VDSISITYALLDPIMTVARPVVAFVTAVVAGLSENLFSYHQEAREIIPDLRCPVDGCCDGVNCDPREHSRHHTFFEKLRAGFGYAFKDLWNDMATWFLFGLLLAGIITVLIPDDIFSQYLGLLAGPATNLASLTVLLGTLGKRATVIYLSSIAVCSVIFGLVVDQIYGYWGFSAQAIVGQASEVVPLWLQWAGALVVVLLSIKPQAGIHAAVIIIQLWAHMRVFVRIGRSSGMKNVE